MGGRLWYNGPMKLYFAPLEGVTDHIYRRIHRRYYPGADKYFTPFLSPTQNHVFPPRELRQVDPANNRGVPVVPQLLTKRAEDFLWAAGRLADMGYEEIDLNAGCPSGTVTAKGKGAGLLADVDSLRRLLDGIFAAPPAAISVKTRLGMRRAEELAALVEVYNDYPIAELTVHARTAAQQYAGEPDLAAFGQAMALSRAPVCYNGDLRTAADIRRAGERYPGLGAVMVGRGIAADPALFARMRGADPGRETLRSFLDELWEAYCAAFGGPASAMNRMKAIWALMLPGFKGGEAYAKALGKTRKWPEFLALARRLADQLEPLVPDRPGRWGTGC